MKNLFFLFAMCSALTFISCAKDKEDPEPSKYMTASIDGNTFEAATISSVVSDSIVLSTGTNEDATFTIGLNIPVDIVVNEELIIDEFDFGITFTDVDDNIFSTVGTVELTENDAEADVLEGVFTFTATEDGNETNVHEITNGTFKFTY